ncbi:MAG: radical SAM protein [Candidatus Aenigmatarchaeota archaeon]
MMEIEKTQSLCPRCMKILPATIFERDGKVWITRTCKRHGKTEELYWGSYEIYKKAKRFARDGRGVYNPEIKKERIVCPFDCGLCNVHKSHTALANIVLTNRCDLRCWYCFFFAQKAGYVYEPNLEQVRLMLKKLRSEKPVPCNAVQFTGGEPLLRNDIIEIIKIARQEGFKHIQLNTDGIRLRDAALAKNIRKAGVNTIYLSFDGVSAKTNPKNHWEIPEILESCRYAEIGVVLVPTIIKGVNDHELGDIIRFAVRNIDVVRGINFQPVSMVGRMSKNERKKYRITIPDVMQRIEEQTKGEISKNDFYTVPFVMPISNFVESITKKSEYQFSSHFACGAATYVFKEDEKTIPITRFVDVEGLMKYLDDMATKIKPGHIKYITGLKLLFGLRKFVHGKTPKGLNINKVFFDAFVKKNYKTLSVFHHKSLFIGLMHFQDLYNYDIERVKRCCIHYATPDGNIIPFCTFNVLPSLYRDKIQKKFGMKIGEWEKKNKRKLDDDLYRRSPELIKNAPKTF